MPHYNTDYTLYLTARNCPCLKNDVVSLSCYSKFGRIQKRREAFLKTETQNFTYRKYIFFIHKQTIHMFGAKLTVKVGMIVGWLRQGSSKVNTRNLGHCSKGV